MSDEGGALLERIGDRRVIASLSGGKDSTAMALHLRELGVAFTPVFFDTGWEHSEVYRYIAEEVEPRFGPVVRLTSARGQMAERIREKGTFPSRLRRWCTSELKMEPLKAYLQGLDEEPVNAVGVRAEESRARAGLDQWEWSKGLDCEVWRPILGWTEEDVIAIHHRHGVEPNRLYLQGARRVGCFPCIYARKEEVRLVADLWSERIDEIAQLETELTERARDAARRRSAEPWPSSLPTPEHLAEAICVTFRVTARLGRHRRFGIVPRWAAAGPITSPIVAERHHLASLRRAVDREMALRSAEDSLHERTFFGRGEKGRGMPCDIRSIVEWSRTAHGGRQFELALDDDRGCMRWGLCDTAAAGADLVVVDDPRAKDKQEGVA